MKPQEIDRIECAIRHIESSLDVDPWAAEIAVDAMMKQIPKKPIQIDKKGIGINWKKVCPSCKSVLAVRFSTSEENYARVYNYSEHCKCGQAIDWEGEG